MTNDAEEMRKVEKEAQSMSARIAADMIRRPGARWLLRPIHRLFKWIEKNADEWLKEEGWR